MKKNPCWFNNFLFICQKQKYGFQHVQPFLALIINCRSHSFYKNNLHVCALVCQINKKQFPSWPASSLVSYILLTRVRIIDKLHNPEKFWKNSWQTINGIWETNICYILTRNWINYTQNRIYFYKTKQIHSHTYVHKFINVKNKYICLMSSNKCSSK